MVEKETRNFALRDKDGNEIGVFTGEQPRQAALKAANRGLYRYQAEGTRNQKSAYIYRREEAGKETQGRASLGA
jgi:hypothetical protein